MINLKFQSFNLCVFFSVQYHVKNTWFFIKTAFVYVYIWNISRVICVLWKVSETFDLQHLITDAFHIRIALWVNWYTISKPDNSNLQVYLFTDYLDISRVFYIQWIWLYLLDIHSCFYSLRKIAVGKIQLCHNSFV